MLRYFRINDPYRLAGLLVIALFLFLPVLIDVPAITYPELKSYLIGEKIMEGHTPYSELIDSSSPITCWFYGLVDFMFGRSLAARHVLSFIIIFIQAILLALIFINRKVFSESTYLPALLTVALYAFSYDTIALTGELIGCFFLLLALNSLFKELEMRTQGDHTVVGLGLLISLASLCSFGYSVFVFGAGFIVIIYSRRELRILFLLFTGFLLPHLLLVCIYYLNGNVMWLFEFYYLPNLGLGSGALVSVMTLIVVGIIPIVFFLASLFIVTRESRLTKYQTQVLRSMFLWLVFSLVYTFLTDDLRPQSLIVFIPPISYFLTHFYLSVQRKLFAEVSIWVFLLGISLVNFVARSGYLRNVSYEKLIVNQTENVVQGKRLLVLSDELFYFQHNSLATPLLDWSLTEKILTKVDYYENLTWLYRAFQEDPPDLIIDPQNYMQHFFEMAPKFKREYVLVETGKYAKR